MRRFLVSTFTRLLRVSLSDEGELLAQKVIHEGLGKYFGLTRQGRLIFVVERNLDINAQISTPGAPENRIRLYLQGPGDRLIRTPIHYGSEAFEDLHQIAHDRSKLFVTSAKYPFLVRRNLLGARIKWVDLPSALPSHIRRGDDLDRDAYHFNSVSVDGEDLFVLAHDWDRPSFALQLSRADAHRGVATVKAVYENLGRHCHDVVRGADGNLWVLDSTGANVVRLNEDGTMNRFHLESAHGDPFPRGLSVLEDRLIVAYGLNSKERTARMSSASFLVPFDLKTETFGAHINLGNHGNTCAVMAL